jgi:hypothetical protein
MRSLVCTAVALALAAPAQAAAPPPASSSAPASAPPPTTPASAPAPSSAPALSSASASASRLAVLPIELTGATDEAAAAILREHLTRGLTHGAFTLVPAAEVEALCAAPGDCAPALRARATFALRAQVSVDDRDYLVRLELRATKDGSLVASSEERCELCGIAEAGALVEAQSALLRRELEDVIKGPPRLSVTTQPAGALVLVDDKLIGRSPVEQNVLAGEHVVRVLLDGYVADEREVKLAAGVREAVTVELRREPKIARYRAVGWAGLATGIPVAAAGVALLALDGRPARGRCEGVDRDPLGNCRFILDTDWGGAVALAAGAALITAGALLLARTRDRTRPRRVRAAIGPTGVGLSGRF